MSDWKKKKTRKQIEISTKNHFLESLRGQVEKGYKNGK